MNIVTRFAPSPNGSLHLGHAYAAIVAHDRALEAGGKFQLRIEDIDGARSRAEFVQEFRDDLSWLGLTWAEVPAQSTRLAQYDAAANRLKAMDLLYPCRCTRADIAAAASETGPEGAIYPGTCKGKDLSAYEGPFAWRLDVARAAAQAGSLGWTDEIAGEQIARPEQLGDVVLMRKDTPASYHLAATVDDAADGVSVVTRGADLFAATHIHRLLQELLGLPVPLWHHHGLLLDGQGQKLAKRRGSASLADMRKRGDDGLLLAEQLRLQKFPADITLSKT